MKVLGVAELEKERLEGVKVPPEPPSEKVIVSVVEEEGVTVKLVLATPTLPDVGPETVSGTVDDVVTVYVRGDPVIVALAELISVRVFTPEVRGV